ncbi:MAG: RNA polymerase sigma factor [Saprospiraceae bacterium]|nr:RNA polymerase sigma factor [Saprospiraceae bacterium]
MTEVELIKKCSQKDRKAQNLLYDQYAPLLFAICRRYLRQKEDAEDVLLESFYKIFANISNFKGQGSFEGWMKRITINQALMFLRKKQNLNLSIAAVSHKLYDAEFNAEDLLFEKDILCVLDQLPVGYRTVFNLYVVEGFKHREIAEKLGISINTSKSQLIQAKKKLTQFLKKNKISAAG